jgi:hypothetical protein
MSAADRVDRDERDRLARLTASTTLPAELNSTWSTGRPAAARLAREIHRHAARLAGRVLACEDRVAEVDGGAQLARGAQLGPGCRASVWPGARAAGQQQPARGTERATFGVHQKSIFWPGSGTRTRVVEAPSADVNSAGVPRSSGKVP